ncbi:MAG TPA: FKBP-type peptidyl-prolyl cis-trans isomerase [Candidatus Paceibacterota bacterium]|nr:FKBP-type peptidyl-prolyl cis-trans isomerase [Candidatus Paceibacterota bacterium]
MNPVQTGIAVALALAVVSIFFIFPGLSPFGSPQVPATTDETAGGQTTTNPTPTTMPTPDATTLQVTDEKVGTGATAAAGDTVTVNYVGMLTNGTVFDASANHGQAFSFTLGTGQVISGWDQGLVGMKEGGKRKLIIPPAMAYGNQEVGGVIPANSTLIFEVELVKVAK